MAQFPGSLPPAGTAVSTNTLAAAGHTALHNTEYDEIRALATKLGTGASTATSGTVLRGTGSGTSAWGQAVLTTDVTGILPVSNGGTGQSSLTGLTVPSATLANPTVSGTVAGSATYTTPTLSSPVIADFSSAAHDHSSSSNGGALGNVVATSVTTNTINGSGHISLTSATSSLVKTSVLRQDNTSNTYQRGNTVILTGWGVMAAGAAATKDEAVTFGVTFAAAPIVMASAGGDDTAGGTTYGAGGNEDKNFATTASGITTTGFNMRCRSLDGLSWAAGTTVFYQWIAIGELA